VMYLRRRYGGIHQITLHVGPCRKMSFYQRPTFLLKRRYGIICSKKDVSCVCSYSTDPIMMTRQNY